MTVAFTVGHETSTSFAEKICYMGSVTDRDPDTEVFVGVRSDVDLDLFARSLARCQKLVGTWEMTPALHEPWGGTRFVVRFKRITNRP